MYSTMFENAGIVMSFADMSLTSDIQKTCQSGRRIICFMGGPRKCFSRPHNKTFIDNDRQATGSFQ